MNRTMRCGRAATLLAACALLAGCTSPAATDKAGGPAAPSVLRMANGYSSLGYEPGLQEFVDAVEEVSGGALVIQLQHEWGDLSGDFEQVVVDAVAKGEVDLGWVATRVFDTMQVTDLQALTAPMLVDSYPLQRAVLESDLPDRMLASLEDLGVEGLGLLAGGLRKPISVDRPLLSLADWQGIRFQTFPSELQTTAIMALGAEPTDVVFEELDVGIADGSIDGFEKNLLIVQVNDQQLTAPYITVNVSLWPETVALIANPELLRGLTDEQRRWVREAASAAVDASADLYDDQAVLDELCATGAIASESTPAQLEELRTAFEPVYAELRQDPVTARYLDEITAMKSGMAQADALEVPEMCLGEGSAEAK